MTVQNFIGLADQMIQSSPLKASWINEVRKNATKSFKESGFPGKSEAYKFTNIEKFLSQTEWKNAQTSFDQKLVENALATQTEYKNLVVFVNGVLNQKLSRHPELDIAPFESGIESEENTLKKFTTYKNDELTHLHLSFINEGIIIKPKKNSKETVKIISLITEDKVFSHPTILVKAEKHSELTVFEECFSVTEKSYSQQLFTFIQVDAGAKVEHIQLVHENNSTNYLNTTEAQVSKDGTYRNITLHLGAALSRKNLAIELLESGAHGESFALYGLKGKQHSDISTQILHKAADTTSAQIAKGILADESRGVFTGKIHIFQEAQRVNSSQLNKNLLLSNKAQAHSQPQLEIFADDVKCSHGSTTGQLQDDELFYFQSRGIPADKARALLAHAFGNEILMKIESKQIRDEINNRVLKEFEDRLEK